MPYPGTQFVNGIEAKLIKRDFECLLASSCESSIITGEFKTLNSPILDEVYGIQDADSIDTTYFTGKAIQQIVRKRDEDLLGFGILEAGDCIFYIQTALDLSQGEPQTLEIIDPAGLHWVPVPRVQKLYQHYLLHRLGQTQVAQVLPCKLKK